MKRLRETVNLTDEMLLTSKLKSLGVKLSPFDGLSTFETRRELLRAAVNMLPDVTYTVRDGKNITLAQQFAKVYGVAL